MTDPCEQELCFLKLIALFILVPLLITALCVAAPLLYVQWRYSMDVWKHHQIAASVFTIEMQPTAAAPATLDAGAV